MTRRLAVRLLERGLGHPRAHSVLGDLEEDLARRRCPGWASRAPGPWLLWQAVTHVVAARWADHSDNAATRPARGSIERSSTRFGTGGNMFSGLSSDVRDAARRLMASPSFAVTTVVTIALGVGLNSAAFSVFNSMVFRDLPVPDGHELVNLYWTPEDVGRVPDARFSSEEYQTFRGRTETLTGLLGYSAFARTVTLGGDTPSRISGRVVTCNYFDVLRQPPILGRGLVSEDCERGGERVVVLGYELWQTAFDADPSIVGHTVLLTGHPFTVVGIASASTYRPGFMTAEYIAPYPTGPLLSPLSGVELRLTGRRRNGVSVDQVRAELDVVAAALDEAQPADRSVLVKRAVPLELHEIDGVSAATVTILYMTPFGLVLLVVCANVMNLFLVRATDRTREIAMRLSLGASRAR